MLRPLTRHCAFVILTMLAAMSSLTCGRDEGGIRKRVSGSYVATYKWGQDFLELKEDGTFRQLVCESTKPGGTSNQGTWSLWKDGIWYSVRLTGLMVVDEGFGELKPNFAEKGTAIWGLDLALAIPSALGGVNGWPHVRTDSHVQRCRS